MTRKELIELGNKIVNPEGIWEKYTWHHFQDGKTIIPVQSNIHTASIGGFKHAGGNSIFLNNIDRIFEFLGFSN